VEVAKASEGAKYDVIWVWTFGSVCGFDLQSGRCDTDMFLPAVEYVCRFEKGI
jgi:hypothetical protein